MTKVTVNEDKTEKFEFVEYPQSTFRNFEKSTESFMVKTYPYRFRKKKLVEGVELDEKKSCKKIQNVNNLDTKVNLRFRKLVSKTDKNFHSKMGNLSVDYADST